MWSQIVLCLLVGLAYASNNPAWKDNSEYVYHVRGRTLTSLHEVSNQYSGILLKAKLHIKPRSEGPLVAKIEDAQYGQIHSELAEGWNSYIPDSEVSYKPLPLSGKPFQIVMENGVVRDLMVQKEIPNWEANIIKSIVSQFQLDTKAQNIIPSHINTLPEGESNNAVFKTMEDTVTGNTETLYDIHQLPEYVLQSKPWLAPQLNLKGDGQIIEIVKNKNYSSSEERPSYHFGLENMEEWEPTSNKLGEFLTRESITRAVVTGNLHRYTVQSSFTVNKILVSPTLSNAQKGSVVSMMNVTLQEVRPQNGQPEEIRNPVSLGNLVYRFEQPYGTNEARTKQRYETREQRQESQEERLNSPSARRFVRSVESQEEQINKAFEQYWQQQQKPKLSEAPESPLLPYTIGYKGMSIKQQQSLNVPEKIQKLAQEIGQEMRNPQEVLKKQMLEKFTILTSLIRLLNYEELQQVAKQLYTQSEEGVQRYTWVAFRDAVAQAGTGPAFLTIQEWIQTKKIQHQEAAVIVAVMAQQTRQPTEEYMRAFYEMITKREVMEQRHLNETALLAYTILVRRVYVDQHRSHNEFPTHAFGSYRTEEGIQFVKETVIPHLTKKLHESIVLGDVRKIHLYIRALGNVAHQQILEAFEPYLEGKKQASQFQRLLMVVALDKLVKVNPILARSVLYKIYQNSGEAEEVRVAAVYQLMRTQPAPDMLQRMAEYTKIDTQEAVNAAVKSAIQNAANLKGEEFEYLRSSAKAAEHYLTQKSYGAHQAKTALREYIVKEMKLEINEHSAIWGSEGSFLPKGLDFGLTTRISGLPLNFMHARAVISSIDELTEALQQQTESYRKAKQQQEQQQAEQHKWSSQYLAKLLNLQVEEKEQLEGFLNLEIGNLQKVLSFDNQTVKMIPELVRNVEDMLKNAKKIQQAKFMETEKLVIAYPTEMGLPFVYHYQRPMAYKVEGKIHAQANPQIVEGNLLRKPETVTLNGEIRVHFVAKTQGQLAFITPFDHQEYASGYDRSFQVSVPLRAKVEIDVAKMQVKAEIEPLEQEEQHVLEYVSTPYTTKFDILNLKPVLMEEHTQEITQKIQQGFEKVLGKKELGMAFRVKLNHEQQFVDYFWAKQILERHDPLTALMAVIYKSPIQRTKLQVSFLPAESANRKVILRFGYQQKYHTEAQDQNESNSPVDLKDLYQTPIESMARQQDFLRKVAAGINNVHIKVVDASIEFPGQVQYILTGAMAKSNVDPKSRMLVYLKKHAQNQEIKPYQIAFVAKSLVPNTNGLDLKYILETEPVVKTQIQTAFGQTYEKSGKIQAQVDFHRTEERKQYLREEPLYHQCQREMQQGNQQLPACANMTIRAGFLDRAVIKIEHDNLTPETAVVMRHIYNALRYEYLPVLDVKAVEPMDKQIKAQVQFAPNFKAVNVTVRAGQEESTVKNIRIPEWMRPIVAVHPVFHLPSRVRGQLLGIETLRQICVVDQTATATFANKTYPMTLGNDWTVMMQYVPRQARQHQQQLSVEEQLRKNLHNYAVLVRKSLENPKQKEVKITFSVPESEAKVVEITMKPVSGSGFSGSKPAAKVIVNGQEVQFDDKKSHDIHRDLVQIYALPNGEVKVEVRNAFYVIFDGARVKLTIVDGKFRSSVRGICGQLNDEKETDFLTAENCIVKDIRQFVQSYTAQEGKQQQTPRECLQKKVQYANVISDIDAGREDQYKYYGQYERQSGMCTKHQTRYVEQNGEICFTLRPVPVCKCQQRGTVLKNVPVFCMQKSNVADLWKQQIQKGASPDFSHKTESRSIQMELPKLCSQ